MAPRIVVCTTDHSAWEDLCRWIGNHSRLDRVDRLEDAAKLSGPNTEIHIAIVDDRFATILAWVEKSLRRYSDLFHNTVILTVAEAQTAHWIGLLTPEFDPDTLLTWMNGERNASAPAAAWR